MSKTTTVQPQQNPHTPNVMKSPGPPEEDVDVFCKDMLFPKSINTSGRAEREGVPQQLKFLTP